MILSQGLWILLRSKGERGKEGDYMEKYVITIARGFGTGGKAIAMELAEELGIQCYENRVLTLAAQLSDIDESHFVEMDEKLNGGYISHFIKELPRRINPQPVDKGFICNNILFEYQVKIIRQLAQNESCIIVGKCADYILKNEPNVMSFYIEAPRNYCVERIKNRMKVSENEARKLIDKTDKYRADYYKYYTGGNEWTNPVNYDMILNNARIGHKECKALIKSYLKMKGYQ